MLKTQKAAKTELKRARRKQHAAEVIGQIQMGETVHIVSSGDWAAHDILLHLLSYTGPAEIWAATWAISNDPAQQLITALNEGLITEMHLIVDSLIDTYRPGVRQYLQTSGVQVSTMPCHTKDYVLINDEWAVSVISSANMTNNPRLEAFVITADREVAEWHRDWMKRLLTKLKRSKNEIDA